MSYTHLTLNERYCLEELKEKGYSIRKISRMMGRSASTISRELKRYPTKKGYVPYYAYSQAVGKRRKAKGSSLEKDSEKKAYVISKLKIHWTPEQISNRWQKEHPESKISTSTIYRHIKRGLLPEISAKKHLRRRGKRKVHRKVNYNTIKPDRIIPEWPVEIRERSRIGDWEGDTINGAQGKGAAVTLVDRKTGYIRGWVIHSKDAETTKQAVISALNGFPVRSISFDNGSEFAEFRAIEKALNAPVFFAEPHKPWQRGVNENANDLLRFFFPKGCNFLCVSQDLFQSVLDLINSRPRKRFNWLAPIDLFPVALD